VIPPENNYKQLDIFVRLKSRLTNPIAVSSVQRDPGHDLALLQLAKPTSADAGGPRCPMPVIVQDTLAPMGTSIYLLGYPLDQDLSLSGGLISNHGDGSRWQTDTVMNSGNSGGPAFEEHGSLVGIAVGGIVKWTFGGETHNVNGVNFLIPTSVIVASPVFKPVLDLPNDRRCWVDASTAISFALPPPIAQSARLNRTYTVNETKDDHPVLLASHSRTYDKPFAAEPGYRIVGCNWRAESANHANDITCNIAAGGASATFSFRLESGPQVDQWRGWWAGSVTVSQALSTAQ
jgi:hypothetical protein